MAELPVELWNHISAYARREDLCQLALVSRLLLDVVRPFLATEINITHNRSTADHQRNLKFLVDAQLSRCIQTINIRRLSEEHAPDIPFQDMPELRVLCISASVQALSKNQQRRAFKALKQSCVKLHTIKVDTSSFFDCEELKLTGVVTVEWREGGFTGFLSPTLFSLCRASLSTIAHLTIHVGAPSWEVPDKKHNGISTYRRFFRLRFPALLSLEIGPGHSSLEVFGNDETDGRFTKFLRAHRTLTKLVLPHFCFPTEEDDGDFYLPVDAEALATADTLPFLRHFQAHPRLISRLLSEDAPFLLNSVQTLVITEALHPDGWGQDPDMLDDDLVYAENMMPIMGVLSQLDEFNGPSRYLSVRCLVLYLSRMNEDDLALSFAQSSILDAAKKMPYLETWIGTILIFEKDFVNLFSMFPNIRTISGKLALGASIEEEAVLALASTCRHLERVDCLALQIHRGGEATNCLATHTGGKSFVVVRNRTAIGKDEITILQKSLPEFLTVGSLELDFMKREALYQLAKMEDSDYSDGGVYSDSDGGDSLTTSGGDVSDDSSSD